MNLSSRLWRKKSVFIGLLVLGILVLVGIRLRSHNEEELRDSIARIRSSSEKKYKFYAAAAALSSSSSNDSPKEGQSLRKEDFEGVRFLQEQTPMHRLSLTETEKIALRIKNKEFLSVRKPPSQLHRWAPPRISPMNSNLEYDIPPPRTHYGDGPLRNENISSGDEEENEGDQPYIPSHRLVHFDLKGAPPNVPFLLQVLRLSKALGATGILLEYEDTFPFSGRLAQASASNHYSREDLKTILNTCASLGFIVIPLIQTFGHMEFILKLQSFSYLRDVPEMPESICPCHPESLGLLQEMVDQVAGFHSEFDSNFQFLHIGCDEVYHLGECEPCKDMIQNGRRNEIFTQHVVNVASYAKKKFGVTPIIWDDMLRNFMSEEMSPLSGLVEPMVWVYAEEVYRFVPTYTWDKLAEVFDTVWTASAFKGAHGSTLLVPNVKRHLENNLNWIDLMKNEEKKFKKTLRGIVITGWQRYDHFAVLCELLPGAIPSLAVDLLATSNGYFNSSLTSQLYKALQCTTNPPVRNSGDDLNLEKDPFLFNQMSWCFFTGSAFFKTLQNLISTKTEVETFIKKVRKDHAWTTDYGMRRNYSSPFRIDEIMGDWDRVYYEIERLMKSAKYALMDIFDVYTQSEWIEQNIYPLVLDMKELKANAQALRKRHFWGHRPLPPLPALMTEFGIGSKDNASSQGHRRDMVRPALVTGRPKRLVQQPDYYRHPPGYKK